MISSSNKNVVPNLLPRKHFIFLAMIVLSVVWEEFDGVDVAVDTIACWTLGMIDRGKCWSSKQEVPTFQAGDAVGGIAVVIFVGWCDSFLVLVLVLTLKSRLLLWSVVSFFLALALLLPHHVLRLSPLVAAWPAPVRACTCRCT